MKKETIKIAYNDNYSGFKLSLEAMRWMEENGYAGKFCTESGEVIVPRHNPVLVRCIEELGERANGIVKLNSTVIGKSELRVAEIEGELYYVIDYDGKETVIGEKDLVSARGNKPAFVDSFNPDKVFFTADTHFGDQALIKFCGRPFKDAEEMDKELIRRWNETVPEDGIVFHLGDFASGNAARWCEILEELHGTIHLVVGNHDVDSAKKDALKNFSSVRKQRLIEIDGQKIYLNHYPYLCYGGAYSGIWQLFGHVHSGPGRNTGIDYPRLKTLFPVQYDVGMDNNDFRPVSFNELRSKIDERVDRGCSQDEASEAIASRTPIIFLDVDGVLVTRPSSKTPEPRPAENLSWLLERTRAKVVVLGGWSSFKTRDLKAGPLKLFADSLIGRAPRAETVKEAIAGWMLGNKGRHRYVVLSSAPIDDIRAVKVNPSIGLSKRRARIALSKFMQI